MLFFKRSKVTLALLLACALIFSSFSISALAVEQNSEEAAVAPQGNDQDVSITSLATPSFNNITSSGKAITFSWDEISGAYSYRIFYKTESSWKAIATVKGTSYTWYGGTVNTQYRFTIRCVDQNGNYCSTFLPLGYIFKFLNDTPRITEVRSASGGVLIKWGAVEGASRYRLFYRYNDSWKAIVTTSDTSYTWSDAKFNTTYRFTVRCLDSSNIYSSSFDSAGYTFKYLADTPHISSVSSVSDGIMIKWGNIDGASQYRLFYRYNNTWRSIATTTAASYTWTDAKVGSTYRFTVRCLDSSGVYNSSFDSAGYTFKYTAATPNIYAVYPSGDDIIIKWNAISGVYGYKVFYRNGTSWKSIGTATTNTLKFSGGVYSTTYRFTVRCIDSSGSYVSDFSRTGYVYTYFLNTPVINKAVRNGRSVTFSWNSVTGGSRYKFFVRSSNTWKSLGYTDTNSFTVDNVTLGQSNIYTVRCVNSSNSYISSFKSSGYSYTLKYETPMIKNVTMENGKAHITWTEIEGAPKYRLFYRTETTWKTIATVTGTSYYLSMDLNETKKFTVRCCDENGSYISSFLSTGFTFTYRLSTPKITSVSEKNITGAVITIRWGAVSGASKYRVFYKNGTSWKKIADVSGTEYNWYFVEPNVSYIYTVRCIDNSGSYISSFDSNGYEYTLKTSYVKTPVISSVSAVSNATALYINWAAVNGAVKYRVFYKTDSSWKAIGDTSSTSYIWKGMSYNTAYTFTVRCVDSNGNYQSYFDSAGVKYTLVKNGDGISIPKGKSYNASKSGVSSWKSSNTAVARVNSLGIIEGVSEGSCIISGGGYSYSVYVTPSEPVRVAYTSPNSAQAGDTVSLVAVTDTDKSAVRFYVGSSYVDAASKTVDYCKEDPSYKVYVWKATYKVTSAGEIDVTAYSKTSSTSWATCDDAKTEIFAMADRDSEVCAERRVSDDGINFIARCEGLISQIEDDLLAPGNFTVGYGRVVYQGQSFYNNLSNSQAYAYLVQTVNDGLYTKKTNSVLISNGAKFKQQHFDALASLVYNLGTGIYSDSDLSKLCKLSKLSSATKSQVVAAFCDYHHAGGVCIEGLLTRRIDECEIFIIGDYTRDYGNKNRCDISYSCSRGISFP